jgi:hypothetical protein
MKHESIFFEQLCAAVIVVLSLLILYIYLQ